MNVYDFDKTIFYPDSVVSFLQWHAKSNPKFLIPYLIKTGFVGFLYFIKIASVSQVTEQLFSFMKDIPDLEDEIERFWDANENKISKWYLAQKKDDDLIISASPEFFLRPIINKLNVKLIGTQLDPVTGKVVGRSNYGKQKVKNFIKSDFFPQCVVDEFYSDSLSDFPLALCADKAFIVVNKGQKVKKWPEITKKISRKIKYTNL